MPMISKTPEKELPGRSVREIEEMIEPIEQYLLQTREVLDRIEKGIAELKKEGRCILDKDEVIHPQKNPAEGIGVKL